MPPAAFVGAESMRGRRISTGEPRCGNSVDGVLHVQDRYQKLEKIGEGACGVVFKCRSKADGQIVAVKKVKFTYEGDGGSCFGVPAAALREVTALKNLARHPNIISLHEAVVEGDRVFLVCDYADRDLRAHMNAIGRLCPQRAKLYAWQVLNGVAHCHSHRLPHRDIKPQNLLVHMATDCLKLCDFSLSRPVLSPLHQQTQRVASLWYRSPEILLGGPAKGMLLDAWSIGCVFGELLKHTPMFPGASEIETLMFQFRTLGTPNESVWSGLSQLPHWKEAFPRFPQPQPGQIEGLMPDRLGSFSDCDPKALTLLLSLLRLQPETRLAPARCLHHCYFFDLDTQVGMPHQIGRARGLSDQRKPTPCTAKKRRRIGNG